MARIALHFDESFRQRIEELYDTKDSETGNAIFPTLASLMAFCAMVGRHRFNTSDGVKYTSKIREVGSDTMHGSRFDEVAFLLALDAKTELGKKRTDGNILSEENEKEMWKYFEDYVFLGFEEIENWLSKRPNENAKDVILSGLKRLEYRGYDSAGIATMESQKIVVSKNSGKVDELISSIVEGML